MPTDISIPFFISYIGLWILVIFQAVVLLGLVPIIYRLQQRGIGVPLAEGQEAPRFSTVTISGTPIQSEDFRGRMTALLFVSPTCSSCAEALAPTNLDYMRYKSNQGNLIIVCRSGREDCMGLARQYELDVPIIADEDEHISHLYNIESVPSAVIIDRENRIKSHGQPQPQGQKEVSDRTAVAAVEGV
jgi:peroxiredoxin